MVNAVQKDLIPTLDATPEHGPEKKKKRPPRKKKKKKIPEMYSEKKSSNLSNISSHQNANKEVPNSLFKIDAVNKIQSTEKWRESELVLPRTPNCNNTKIGLKSAELPLGIAKEMKSDVWQAVTSDKNTNQNNLNGLCTNRNSALVKKQNPVAGKAKATFSSKPVTQSWEVVSKTKSMKETPHNRKESGNQQKTPWAQHARNSKNPLPNVRSQQIAKSNDGVKSIVSDWRTHKVQQRMPSQKPPSLSNSTAFPSLGDASNARKKPPTMGDVWGNSSGNQWGVKK